MTAPEADPDLADLTIAYDLTAALTRHLAAVGPTTATPSDLAALMPTPVAPADISRHLSGDLVPEWLWADGWRVRLDADASVFTFDEIPTEEGTPW